MQCRQEKNLERCNCTYEPCPRKGICCECIQYHL
ncbi:MAG: cytosolic protein, partial [Opitutae bacterium]|nr:cytosolic protein [Opitutae bacterium]